VTRFHTHTKPFCLAPTSARRTKRPMRPSTEMDNLFVRERLRKFPALLGSSLRLI
jgi:hypothetical protein